MAATVHPLFSNTPEPKAAAHPLFKELQETSLRMLDEIVRRMFDNADDALFEMGEKAPNDSERRRYFDTMRVLRIDRNRVTREFSQQLSRGFAAAPSRASSTAALDLDSLSIQPTEELEERIALSNLAGKIGDAYKGLIWDLERRLEIAQARGVPVAPNALSPAKICEAFGAATAVLDTDFQVKLVVFKLFDRILSRDLEQVYLSVIALLEREGIDTRRPGVAPQAQVQAGRGASAAQSPQDLLRQYGLDAASLRLGDDPAAGPIRDMLQALAARGGMDGFEASAQRLSMAGHLFNELIGEPLLSDSLRASFEPLRYPVYRTALTDPGFFTNSMHPARKMLADVVELAAATQTGEVSTTRFRSILQAMVEQANGFAAGASPSGFAAAPGSVMSGIELDGFVAQLREQSRARRNALLLHVRRLISQELELRTIGRDVPKPVLNLLRSGVGPLMAVRLLKHGRGSPVFREAEGLLDRILATLEVTPPAGEAESASRKQLCDEMSAAFREVGMPDERVGSLITGLAQTWAALDVPVLELGKAQALTDIERAQLLAGFDAGPVATPEVTDVAAPAAAAPQLEAPAAEVAAPAVQSPAPASAPDASLPKITALELLSRVLTPESWFRVYDAAQNQTRWLKLASFYANQDSVTFTGFDESTRLSLRASRLADDLVQGHSEPINPTSSAREALEQLRQAKARGLL